MARKNKINKINFTEKLENLFIISGPKNLVNFQLNNIINTYVKENDKVDKLFLQGKEIEDSKILELICSKFLFYNKKIIVFNELNSSQKNIILNNLNKISSNKNCLVIILCLEISKEDKKNEFYSTFNKLGNLIECYAAIDEYGKQNFDEINKIKKWITEELKENNLSLTNSSIDNMMFLLGYDISLLSGEINKLKFFALNNNGVINDSELSTILYNNIESSAFMLQNQLESGEEILALRSLYFLLNKNNNSVEDIVSFLLSRLKVLLLVKHYINLGFKNEYDILNKMKEDANELEKIKIKSASFLHPYVIQLAVKTAINYDYNNIIYLRDLLFRIQMYLRGFESSNCKINVFSLISDFIICNKTFSKSLLLN